MPATSHFSAIAHQRQNHTYSTFHQSLLHDNSAENYALRHLYSLENTKTLLEGWGWTTDQIKVGFDNLTIDVYERVVYLHIPNYVVKKGLRTHTRGLSRFVSKGDFVQVLIDRSWAKADPYKLQPGTEWDEMIAMGNTGDFYELHLNEYSITCTCHAYKGLEKAFQQDIQALKHLISNPVTQGQLPDKHIFAVWKYLNAETQRQYEYQFMERRERQATHQQKWQYEPVEELELEEIEF